MLPGTRRDDAHRRGATSCCEPVHHRRDREACSLLEVSLHARASRAVHRGSARLWLYSTTLPSLADETPRTSLQHAACRICGATRDATATKPIATAGVLAGGRYLNKELFAHAVEPSEADAARQSSGGESNQPPRQPLAPPFHRAGRGKDTGYSGQPHSQGATLLQ